MGQRYFPKHINLDVSTVQPPDITGHKFYVLDAEKVQSGSIFTNFNSDGDYDIQLPNLHSPAWDGYEVHVLQVSENKIVLRGSTFNVPLVYFLSYTNTGGGGDFNTDGQYTKVNLTFYNNQWYAECFGAVDN